MSAQETELICYLLAFAMLILALGIIAGIGLVEWIWRQTKALRQRECDRSDHD